MDSTTNTEKLPSATEVKTCQENILLEIIKEVASGLNSRISLKLKEKVCRIIANCDIKHYSSLHKISTADESTCTLLGLIHQTATELTFDEQAELNQAIIAKIQTKLPKYIAELNSIKQSNLNHNKSRKEQIKELQDTMDSKLTTLQEQENEKVDLMLEWLNHRLQDAVKFSDNSSELLTLKTKILELKSKILHLQILQNIFTETNQSIIAYSEIHKDLKESIMETEQRIKHFHEIIESDYN